METKNKTNKKQNETNKKQNEKKNTSNLFALFENIYFFKRAHSSINVFFLMRSMQSFVLNKI